MRSSCMSVRLSVCPSVRFHDNSRTSRRRMMKLCTYILEVNSNIELEDESRTWPLTRSNLRFNIMHMQRVHINLHNVHLHRTHSCGILPYMCHSSLSSICSGMLCAIVLYVRLSVRPSVCFPDNSRISRRRMMKLCTIIVDVNSNIEFEDGSRTWPLTPSNWRFYIMHMDRVHIFKTT